MLTRWYQYDDTKCIFPDSRAPVNDLEIEDCSVHCRTPKKIYQATVWDWHVITSHAKSCGCVSLKCAWLFRQVSVFPLSFRLTFLPFSWIVGNLSCFMHQLISLCFSHMKYYVFAATVLGGLWSERLIFSSHVWKSEYIMLTVKADVTAKLKYSHHRREIYWRLWNFRFNTQTFDERNFPRGFLTSSTILNKVKLCWNWMHLIMAL